VKKGDLVRVKAVVHKYGDVTGFRSTTQQEQEEWRKELTRDIHAGLTTWHDSSGEPKLAPQTRWIDLKVGESFLVLRARAHARVGWGNGIPKCAYLACPRTGQKFYIHREDLEVVSER